MAEEIINRIAQAGIEQIDLADFNVKQDIVGIDLKDRLWNELVLKEKDFRHWVKATDWTQYDGKYVHVFCSSDAIIPAWAYMLVTAELDKASVVYFGDLSEAQEQLFFDNLRNWDISHLKDKRVMVKGCSDIPNPQKAYVVLTRRLQPVVRSLMFGEPCSAVPVYKQK